LAEHNSEFCGPCTQPIPKERKVKRQQKRKDRQQAGSTPEPTAQKGQETNPRPSADTKREEPAKAAEAKQPYNIRAQRAGCCADPASECARATRRDHSVSTSLLSPVWTQSLLPFQGSLARLPYGHARRRTRRLLPVRCTGSRPLAPTLLTIS